MLNRIIAFSVRNKLIVGLCILGLVIHGIDQVSRLPIDAVPDITNNQVQIITTAPSFGATDIERLVTLPIEQATSNIAGIEQIRSFSRFGLSLVTIVFSDETEIYWARQQVTERLQEVKNQIPPGIGSPSLGPISTGLGEIYQYVVKARKGFEQQFDATQLRTIQDWIIRRQLLGVEGIADVSSFGGKLKQYEIAIQASKLSAYGLSIADVFNAVHTNNQNTGGAYIEKGASVLYIRSEGLVGNIEDIEQIAIPRSNHQTPLFIKDVASVKIGFATRYGAMSYNDEGEVVGAVVMMLKGANSNTVIQNVKKRIAQIEKTLPEGVEIEPFLDRTKMINNAMSTVRNNLIEGALIVIFVLVIFLGNLRAGLLIASVIPLSMLFAVCMMNLFGVSGNLMSLGALDFGLIVDGAVIIVEAVIHQFAFHKKRNSILSIDSLQMNNEVITTSSKMMNSAVFGQVIILIVYLPIFTLKGIEGKMFIPMAQTVVFALLGAFLLSLTYVPMMCAFFLSKKIEHRESLSEKIMRRIEKIYTKALARVLRFPKIVLSVVGSLFLLTIVIITQLGGEFIPTLEEGDFAVETKVLTGSNLKTTLASVQQAARILKEQFPEVIKVVGKIGSGEIPTDPMPMEACDMMVILKDKSEWKSARTFDELSEKMGRALNDIPGLTASFQFPVQMRFNELMTGAKQDVVCKIFGDNLDTLAMYANRLAKLASHVRGAENIFVEPIQAIPQIVVAYNRQQIAQYHLSIEDVNKVVNTAFAGQSTGFVFEGEKRFDLVVRLENAERRDLEDVRNLLIPTANGIQIPLYQLATVEIKNGPNQILRENAKRRIVVGFNVRGRDVQSIVEELQQNVDLSLPLGVGYHIVYGGAFENLSHAKKRLSIAVPTALLLIFILLFFAFKSVKQGLLIYTAIPLSAIGGVFLLAIRGMPFSISAGVGFVALFGVAVLNGIVLIAEFNRLKKQGVRNVVTIVLRGTQLRLRPVLMTAFVASLGFLPMAISNGAGAEVQRPLATVVIGGLLVATFLTLFFLPLLYVIVEKKTTFPRIKKGLPILLALLTSASLFSQKTLQLDEAIQIALEHNMEIKHEQLRKEYSEAVSKTAFDIPQAAVTAEVGQINGFYIDTKLGISQSIQFPTIYNKQKKVLKKEWEASLLGLALKKHEIRKSVTRAFYNYLYWQEKRKLLQQADTLYKNFYDKANLRLKAGASSVIEKVTSEAQWSSITLQLKKVEQEMDIAMIELQLLLNTTEHMFPLSPSGLKLNDIILADSSSIHHHPSMRIIQQEKDIQHARTQLERSKLLPNLTVGYYNSSFQGTGADNKNYTTDFRFSSALFGIGVPLFWGAQHGKIKSARMQEKMMSSLYEATQKKLLAQRQELDIVYENLQLTIQYMENTALPNAHTIIKTATQQFGTGEIDYLSFVLLTNQAITIQNNYIDAVKSWNDTTIDIQFLNANE